MEIIKNLMNMQFLRKMIVTLQSCTDEKSTFSHSSEFPIILYTVLNENPLKDFLNLKRELYIILCYWRR